MTQKEIAKALALSQATVSMALSGSPKISEGIRAKVLDLARSGGYSPNLNARALQARKSGLIGVLFPGFSQAYYNDLKKEMLARLKERGYAGIYFTDGEDGDALELIENLSGRGVEGVVACYASGKSLQALRKTGLPLVFYRKPELEGFSFVDVDRRDGGRMTGRHLLSLGYESFACLCVEDGVVEERFQGFLEALRQAGVPSSLIDMIPGRQGMEGGYDAFKAFLKRRKTFPRAVFAFNDATAIGGMRAAIDMGFKVPETIAFAGFDDIDEARFFIPSLTTVAQPRAETARTLLELLFERLSGSSAQVRGVSLKTRLAVRESCGAKALRRGMEGGR